MTFAEKINALRTEHELSMKKFAEKVGFANSSVSDYENARARPSKNRLRMIVSAFELPQDYFNDCEYIKREKPAPKEPSIRVIHHTKKINLESIDAMRRKYEQLAEQKLLEIAALEDELTIYEAVVADMNELLKINKPVEVCEVTK